MLTKLERESCAKNCRQCLECVSLLLHAGLMDGAEVEEVIHLVDRQKKRLHFAGSLMHVQPACKELRQMPLFQGLNDQDFAKVHKHSFANILFLFAFPEKAQPPDLHDDVLLMLTYYAYDNM